MRFDIEWVLYFYLFICFSLLLFNIAYIMRAKWQKKSQYRLASMWMLRIMQLWEPQGAGRAGASRNGAAANAAKRALLAKHQHLLEHDLKRVEHLSAYHQAVLRIQARFPREQVQAYLNGNFIVFQYLASVYANRNPMEKAYYAYLISLYRPCDGSQYLQLMELLLSYLENSTVYCRENVLKALYALGNVQAVENAYQIINDRGWFHHPKLLSDGLMTFTGGKAQLAARLWAHHSDWNANLTVSAVQFITSFSGEYQAAFLPLLESQETDLELRIAIMRYYRRYPYQQAHAQLLLYVLGSDSYGSELSTVAASVLDRYPSAETVQALKTALRDRNWYVRYNAASSLVTLGLPKADAEEILNGTDRYAREMMAYRLSQVTPRAEHSGAQLEQAAAHTGA